MTLPNKPITVVPVRTARAPPTTSPSTSAAGGADWTLGSGDTVAWPATTQAGEKNGGVAQLIKAGDGTIGYVDFADAKARAVTAAIKNKDGQFVAPSSRVPPRRSPVRPSPPT